MTRPPELTMRLPYELYVAFRYLRFHRGSAFLSVITMISVAGVTVGTAALVIALALMTGFQNDVRDRVLRGSAHLTVMSATGSTFPLEPELLETIVGAEGVKQVGPVLYAPAMLTNDEFGAPTPAQVFGIDADRHGEVILLGQMAEPFAALEQPTRSGREGIVLGRELADQLGALEGDAVRVLVPRATLTPGGVIPRNMVFEVVGYFDSESYLHDSQRAYVRLPAAQRLMRADGRASMVELRVEDERRLRETQQAVSAVLGDGWSVYDMLQQNEEFLRALNTEKVILFLAIGLIVVVAALNIASTLVLMVADKIKEIGTLTAMGARPAGIARIFILQGVIIGTIGTAAGLVLGTVLSLLADHYRWIELDQEVYYLSHVPFTPTPGDMVFAAALALAVSFVATIYPALRAARMDPVEALRYE